MAKDDTDMLLGMKAIRQALGDISEDTVLKWYREFGLPIKKRGGIWTGSKSRIERWWREVFTA